MVTILIVSNPGTHALVLRKVANTIRDSVYAQYVWAIGELGMAEKWDAKVSPMELIYKPTGQKIMFRGADDPMKIKSVKDGEIVSGYPDKDNHLIDATRYALERVSRKMGATA